MKASVSNKSGVAVKLGKDKILPGTTVTVDVPEKMLIQLSRVGYIDYKPVSRVVRKRAKKKASNKTQSAGTDEA